MNFYGFVGNSKVCLSYPSPSITGGEHFVWSLSSGGDSTAVAGFQGYAIARCDFQYAHGYAFISDLGAQKLAQGYLTNPQVTVAVETYKSQRILVLGEVRSPGSYPLTGEMSLIEALAKAGSTSPDAGPEVLIVRGKPGDRTGGPIVAGKLDESSVAARVDLHLDDLAHAQVAEVAEAEPDERTLHGRTLHVHDPRPQAHEHADLHAALPPCTTRR